MNNLQNTLSSDKPVVTIMTIVVVAIAVVVGGVVTITNPQSLSFHQYLQDLALMGGALGLGNGIGRGIESHGKTSGSLVINPSADTELVTAGSNVTPDMPIGEAGMSETPFIQEPPRY